jgi:DNA primase
MRFSDSLLDEIRTRLSVSQVVSRKVALKRAGREFKGLSPFKQERTPSFTVNDQKGFYHCFASGEHGDIFTFVVKTEGLSFPEAVERLAAEAGVPLPKQDPIAEKRLKQQLSLIDAMESAADLFVQALQSVDGASAREYIERRRLTPETVREFRFGYAPADRSFIKNALLKKGFSEQQLVDCGLLIRPDGGGSTYDRFRDRLMIPIQDQRGRVIAFGGRAIGADTQPKYLNSPETELFHKGSMVFNFHRARQTAFEKDEVIVVEGYLDAIAVYEAGLKNVVATLGTAFTEDQIKTLWRLASSPIVCFDGDKAGELAAFRVIDRILPGLQVDRSFRFAFLPDAKDPDDLVRQDGTAAFSAILKAAVPLHEALWRRELRTAQLDTPEGKAGLERRFYRVVEAIQDAAVRRHYVTTLKVRLSKFFWDHERKTKRSGLYSPDLALSHSPSVELIVLGMAVEYPEMFENHFERVGSLAMTDEHAAFVKALIDVILSSEDRLVATIYHKLDRRYFQVLSQVHGDEDPARKIRRGHKLFLRCRLLEMEPDYAFVEDFFLLHLVHLELNAAKTERDAQLRDYERDQSDENGRLLLELTRAIENRQEQVRRLEHDLDERASDIRDLYDKRETARPKPLQQQGRHHAAVVSSHAF